jgi:hypothetical protein
VPNDGRHLQSLASVPLFIGNGSPSPLPSRPLLCYIVQPASSIARSLSVSTRDCRGRRVVSLHGCLVAAYRLPTLVDPTTVRVKGCDACIMPPQQHTQIASRPRARCMGLPDTEGRQGSGSAGQRATELTPNSLLGVKRPCCCDWSELLPGHSFSSNLFFSPGPAPRPTPNDCTTKAAGSCLHADAALRKPTAAFNNILDGPTLQACCYQDSMCAPALESRPRRRCSDALVRLQPISSTSSPCRDVCADWRQRAAVTAVTTVTTPATLAAPCGSGPAPRRTPPADRRLPDPAAPLHDSLWPETTGHLGVVRGRGAVGRVEKPA